MTHVYIQAVTPWKKLRIQRAMLDTPANRKLIDRYQRYVNRILWRYGELTEQRNHGLSVKSGVTQDGNYLVIARRQRIGYQPRMVYHLFHGPELEPLIAQAKRWATVRVTKPVPWQHTFRDAPFRVLCGNPSAYFEGKRLPAGIQARELSIPNTFRVTLLAQGRTISSELLNREQVRAHIEYLKVLKSSL